MRIERFQRARRALNLQSPDILRFVQYLPLQIGERDAVVIDEAQAPHPSRRQIERRGRPQAAHADDGDGRCLQALLTRSANLLQHDVARVALALVL
jgi:hypothetical protein